MEKKRRKEKGRVEIAIFSPGCYRRLNKQKTKAHPTASATASLDLAISLCPLSFESLPHFAVRCSMNYRGKAKYKFLFFKYAPYPTSRLNSPLCINAPLRQLR